MTSSNKPNSKLFRTEKSVNRESITTQLVINAPERSDQDKHSKSESSYERTIRLAINFEVTEVLEC